MKKLTWLADSRAHIKAFPASFQDDIGYSPARATYLLTSVRPTPLNTL